MAWESALELHEQIKSGKRTAVSVLDETYQALDATEPQVSAYQSLTKDLAYETAQGVDNDVKAGKALPLLAGVPIGVKDNINVVGYPTTCSSKILENYVSPYNATVTEKLLAHQMPIVGKTNLDEFAMGSSTENSAFHTTKNPWDLERVPGGSSGGSAVTVAAGQVPLSLGSDTGGSVRQPASLCGIYGFKPTYGTVSRYGLVAFASSLDQISPFARNVDDLAAIMQVISGSDPSDSTSIQDFAPVTLADANRSDLKGLRVGVISELDSDDMTPDVLSAFHQSVDVLKNLGATVSSVSLPSTEAALAAYYIIATAEASSNLARFDGVRYGQRVDDSKSLLDMYKRTRGQFIGPEVKRRILLGTYALSSGYYDAYYGKAQKVRELIRREFKQAWDNVDVLVCPTSPTTAFKIGEKSDDPVSMYLSDIATIPVNLAGIPAMSIPCGFDNQGLPIGLQVLAPHLQESRLLQVAKCYESQTDFSNRQPMGLKATVSCSV